MGVLITDSHNIWARRMNHFFQLLNVHGVNDVRQKGLHTAETPVPEPCVFDVEMAVGKLKIRHNHHVLIKFQQN